MKVIFLITLKRAFRHMSESLEGSDLRSSISLHINSLPYRGVPFMWHEALLRVTLSYWEKAIRLLIVNRDHNFIIILRNLRETHGHNSRLSWCYELLFIFIGCWLILAKRVSSIYVNSHLSHVNVLATYGNVGSNANNPDEKEIYARWDKTAGWQMKCWKEKSVNMSKKNVCVLNRNYKT